MNAEQMQLIRSGTNPELLLKSLVTEAGLALGKLDLDQI